MTVSGRRSGRLSVASQIAMRPGSRTRLCHRLRTHPAGKGKRHSMDERDFISLLDGVHQPVRAPIVLIWDRLNTHVPHVKHSLANLAVMALDRLETLVHNRLERLQKRPTTLDGVIAGTGRTLDTPASP
ncbi:IS630 family transposase [Streptomyces sp. NPDC056492]|uniref:IS630 family transposase n=1 Tax=unclassified Streptomyces TaxID=2593676 RepID=UPI0036AFFFD8